MKIYYIDRKNGLEKLEKVAGDQVLKWIYHSKTGMGLLEMIIKRKIFSSVYGKLQDFSYSKRKIKSFVKDIEIDMGEAERENISDYKHFNDFFIRKLKKEARPISREESDFISPADGRIFAYENIDINKVIQVKGFEYKLEELFADTNLAKKYTNGTCIVIRLCPADYHRFHFPDSGIAKEVKKISGKYYSVNPIALKEIVNLYCRNKREITVFNSEHFGDMIFVEVGATCVGSIIQTYEVDQPIEKGAEKGYFKFGGSTVILFIEKGKLKVDEDIIINTKNGIETKVNMGETIAKKI
ncbi:phosphatidylserine decarboxylase [Lutibacter sp. B2]|nr:phosphatidylserine decarboxylase [Lutibacter sp. B2]